MDEDWRIWAYSWLIGEDRTEEAVREAADALVMPPAATVVVPASTVLAVWKIWVATETTRRAKAAALMAEKVAQYPDMTLDLVTLARECLADKGDQQSCSSTN
jgi:hypothetical protein